MAIKLWLCMTKNNIKKNTPPSRAILVAMRIKRYNAKLIARDGRSRVTLDAIRNHHWERICPVLPRQMPWSSILAQKIKLWCCEIAVPKLAFKRHNTDPLLRSSKQQAA
jgi:hypothetical protein